MSYWLAGEKYDDLLRKNGHKYHIFGNMHIRTPEERRSPRQKLEIQRYAITIDDPFYGVLLVFDHLSPYLYYISINNLIV